MADNLTTNPGTGGATIATDDIAGVHYPISKLAFGVLDSATLVSASNALPVAVSNMVAQGITDTQIRAVPLPVTMSNTLALTDTQLRATAVPISLATAPVTPVTGTFFQTTQPVSLATAPITPVTGTFFQTTQPVSGAFFQTTQPVSGAFFQTTQPVSMATAPTTPVTGTFFQTTQPVSMATAPSTPVTGTFWQTTQPVSGTVSVTGYPTAAASADGFANPTVTKVDATMLTFNGASWDRVRGMSTALTTGDTGAKIATGTGANVTSVGNKGVQILVNMGAVTGTTPTAVFKVQGSTDAGTSWYDIPGATTATLVATGVFGITIYPGIAVTAGTATTGTTATANMVIPRVWRLVWTIGGTTPSFTITNIQYIYLPN